VRYLIYTSGGAAKRAITLIHRYAKANPHKEIELVGLLDDDLDKVGEEVLGYKVLGNYRYINCGDFNGGVIIPIADVSAKLRILNDIHKHANFGSVFNHLHDSIIDPSSYVDDFAKIKKSVLISANSVIMPEARIGGFVNICMDVSVSHDVYIGEYTTVYNGAKISGGASIGEGCIIGAGAVILPGRKIADSVTVGAGAVVTKDIIEPHSVVVGNPARDLHESTDCLCSNL
jgi:sugar O-acyltransferase (sialic acid O-acetyltransferase NeuD family)